MDEPWPPALPWTRTMPLVTSSVFVIGSPTDLQGSFSSGSVSGLRDIAGIGRILQVTAPLGPSSSGSPVFNDERQVIGIAVSSVRDGQVLNFVVPLSRLPDGAERWLDAADNDDELRYFLTWAYETVVDSENAASQAIFREAKLRVTEGLKGLISEAELSRSHTVEGPLGESVSIPDLQMLLAAIEDATPDRLLPGETSTPQSAWSRAVSLLDDDDWTERKTMVAAASKAWQIGTRDRDTLQWVASFCSDLDALHKAADAIPDDESITWSLLDAEQEYIGNICMALIEVRDGRALGDANPFAAEALDPEHEMDRIPKLTLDALESLDELRQANGAWSRVPAYWRTRGWMLLVAGRHEEAEQCFEIQFQADGLTAIDELLAPPAQSLATAYKWACEQQSSLDPLRTALQRRYSLALQMQASPGAKSSLLGLHVEAEAILTVLEERSEHREAASPLTLYQDMVRKIGVWAGAK